MFFLATPLFALGGAPVVAVVAVSVAVASVPATIHMLKK